MYLDHCVTAKITHILEQIDMSAFLMDNNGTVVLPEGDVRQLTLPDQLRRDPTTPMVYGGVTLIGTDERQPLFICLHGDSPEVKNCELINMLCRGRAVRAADAARRSGGRGTESLAAEHKHRLEKNRCVMYTYFAQTSTEDASTILEGVIDPRTTGSLEVRHSLALMKTLDEDMTPRPSRR